MISFNWYTFNELTNHQLYDVLALRADVFVVDQRCYYLDPDGKDLSALHLLGAYNNKLASYLRWVNADLSGSKAHLSWQKRC